MIQFKHCVFFSTLLAAFFTVSCAGGFDAVSGASVNPVMDSAILEPIMVHSDYYRAVDGEMVYQGYYQIATIDDSSRYKIRMTGAGPDGRWKTGDDEAQFYYKESFAADGRLLQVETYGEFAINGGGAYFTGSDMLTARLENVGLNEDGQIFEQAFTQDGERRRRVYEYDQNGFNNKITYYDGANLVTKVQNYIWETRWDGNVMVARRYGATEYGVQTANFVEFHYENGDMSRLIKQESFREAGMLNESAVADAAFTGMITALF